jgi:eukaryotic-like serine/threonine-protein kinase
MPPKELSEAALDARYEPGTPVRYFGHFQLLDEGREGGMGVVYHARQLNLKREVALKMILGHCLRSADLVRRFRREVEVLARLDHPNVLPIFEVGEQHGQHYYCMKWVAEGSLADQFERWRLSGPGELKERQRRLVELLLGITRGVQHAHQRGILHRDLKPANVLVDAAGQPYVADFGLAKWAEDEEGGKTQTRAVLGSPAYMSPEQAAGGERELTTATDVWALGVILYELLTGQRPFVGSNNAAILKRVLEMEPEGPRRVDPRIDRDLETICQKCLEKEPGRRYTSAEALGEELKRWLRGEPIAARPVTGLERLGKWARRRPVVAGWIGATALALVLGFLGTTWQWRQARENAHLETVQRALADERADAIRHGYYAAKVVFAQQAVVEGRYDVARAHLDEFVPGPDEADIRGFSWRLVDRLLASIQPVEWADESAPEPVHAVAQDGSLLAVNEALEIKVWHLGEHRLIATVPDLDTSMLALAFSADNRWLVGAGADATLRLWETTSGQELRRLTADTPLAALSWTLSAGVVGLTENGLLKGWDDRLENERDIRQFAFKRVEIAAFSPNGVWVAMTGDEGLLVAQWLLPVEPLRLGGYEGTLHALAFSSDGQWLAATGLWERAPRVWRLPKGEPGQPLVPGLPMSTSVAFSSEGAEVIAGSGTGGLRVWELDTGRSRADWFGHNGAVLGVAATAGGRSLVSWGGCRQTDSQLATV